MLPIWNVSLFISSRSSKALNNGQITGPKRPEERRFGNYRLEALEMSGTLLSPRRSPATVQVIRQGSHRGGVGLAAGFGLFGLARFRHHPEPGVPSVNEPFRATAAKMSAPR